MTKEDKIRRVLSQVVELSNRNTKHNSSVMEDLVHNTYEEVLNIMDVGSEFSDREPYYEVFAEHSIGGIDIDKMIRQINEIHDA